MPRLLYGLLIALMSGANLADDRPPSDNVAPVPEPPELPLPVQSGEEMEPDITIIRKGKDTIQEYRRNGKLYQVKVVPAVGPAYYLVDTNGDEQMDVKRSDIDKTSNINRWTLFEWDW